MEQKNCEAVELGRKMMKKRNFSLLNIRLRGSRSSDRTAPLSLWRGLMVPHFINTRQNSYTPICLHEVKNMNNFCNNYETLSL
jgi:3'-phosphoadenosine 5'-phosphosulfate sulfotransferase (PAPS reductase)/FAD synthetase